MLKINLKNALLGIGLISIIGGLLVDVMRGRSFSFGPAQFGIIIVGILIILTTLLFSKNLEKRNWDTSPIIDITKNTNTKEHVASNLVWKTLNLIALVVMFGILLKYAVDHLTNYPIHPWFHGDWLINYQGGFVRRGLIGEIILWLSRIFNVRVIVLVVTTQLLVFLLFYVNVFKLVQLSSFTPLNIALVYSPAFMLFAVNDPNGGFRKEVLFLAFFSWLCYKLASSMDARSSEPYIFISLTAIVMVLSHEMIMAFLPYLVCAFLIYDGGFSKRTWKVIAALIPAFVIGAIIILFSRGNDQIVVSICNSLLDSAPNKCANEGAIASLSHSIGDVQRVVRRYNDFETQIAYLIATFLGLLPLLLHHFSKPIQAFLNENRLRTSLMLGILTAILTSLPLFWVAADYGRVIYLHISSLSLLALLINSKTPSLNPKFDLRWGLGLIGAVFFIISWRLVHSNASISGTFPLLQYFLFIR